MKNHNRKDLSLDLACVGNLGEDTRKWVSDLIWVLLDSRNNSVIK